MDGAADEESDAALRVTFDRRLKLEFHGSPRSVHHSLLGPSRYALSPRAVKGERLTKTSFACRMGRTDCAEASEYLQRNGPLDHPRAAA